MLKRFAQVIYLIGFSVSILSIVIVVSFTVVMGSVRDWLYLAIVAPILIGWVIKFIVTGDKSFKPKLGDDKNK